MCCCTGTDAFIWRKAPNVAARENKVVTLLTSRQGKSLVSSEKSGRRTKRMKLVCEDGLDTLSRSMNAVTGRPWSFSVSLCTQEQKQRLILLKCVRRIVNSWVVIPAKNREPGWRTPAANSPARARPRPSAWPRWRCRSLSPWSSSAKEEEDEPG